MSNLYGPYGSQNPSRHPEMQGYGQGAQHPGQPHSAHHSTSPYGQPTPSAGGYNPPGYPTANLGSAQPTYDRYVRPSAYPAPGGIDAGIGSSTYDSFPGAGQPMGGTAHMQAPGASKRRGLKPVGVALIVIGVLFGISNTFNSLGLLEYGVPFLVAYFQVDMPIHAVQSSGSILLPIIGIVLLIVGSRSSTRNTAR